MPEHDFSRVSDHCVECGLPISCWDAPCVSSTDDSAVAVARVAYVAQVDLSLVNPVIHRTTP